MITQLPYLCGHNVRYRAGLDKCGQVCYSEYHQVAYGECPYGLRVKGVVNMTTSVAELPSLLDMEALERTPELIDELMEALRWGRPVTVSSTEIVVEPLEGLDDGRYPIWGEPNSWHLAQEILGEVDDPVEGSLVQVGELKYIKWPFSV